MGSGKTSVGVKLAKALSYDFMDTDECIVKKYGQSIKEIFTVHGETYFRNLETNFIKELTGKISNTIISVGGGLPIQPGNGALLHELGTVVYLSTSSETIRERLQGDITRPLLIGQDGKNKLEELYTYREPIYRSNAQLIITTDHKSIEEIVSNILDVWREQ